VNVATTFSAAIHARTEKNGQRKAAPDFADYTDCVPGYLPNPRNPVANDLCKTAPSATNKFVLASVRGIGYFPFMKNQPPPAEGPGEKTMRVDKWLKSARIYKSREEAARVCDMGRVKINGQEAKPSKEVKAGDELIIKMQKHYRTLQIKEIPTRGLSKKDAKLVYHESTPELSPETVEMMKLMRQAERALPPPEKGRPTKRDRRVLERFRGRA
jgi:ribosome-associated heat shock protein Hsp15